MIRKYEKQKQELTEVELRKKNDKEEEEKREIEEKDEAERKRLRNEKIKAAIKKGLKKVFKIRKHT